MPRSRPQFQYVKPSKRMLEILRLDRLGLTPTEVSQRTGIDLKCVGSLRSILRRMGYRLITARKGPMPVGSLGTDRGTECQEWVPADEEPDEQPETDGKLPPDRYITVQRCECGLMVDAEHPECDLTLAELATRKAGRDIMIYVASND